MDNIFLYSYQSYMKKHDSANDTPSFLFDDDEDEFLGGPA